MRTCYQSVASHGVIRPRFAEKVYFILLFAHFVLVHVIKRISNEFSFHTMYYETRCVLYIPSPEARGYKTHNSFHNTSYGMKIHLRSYISYHIYVGIQSARGTLKCDGHAKVQWFALKCDGVPYNEETLKCDGLTCQSAMASPIRKKTR